MCGLLFLAAGCGRLGGARGDGTKGDGAEGKADQSIDPADLIVKSADEGPLKVTVTLGPKKPRLGDSLVLTLRVVAEGGVAVEMPPFGEALGRFTIVSFTPRQQPDPGGGTAHIQRYVLDAPMSGPQRVPSLRIEYEKGGESHEVLTEEIPIEVASVLAGTGETLRPARGPLAESDHRLRPILLGVGGVVATLLAALLLLRRGHLQRKRAAARLSAYDQAQLRLTRLEKGGLPRDAGAVDPFYVELSDIVRHYIEDRYGVRAPELTTEEFLREAQHLLLPNQRDLLQAFLAGCDRVKFAGHRPQGDEARLALRDAWSFLEETRDRAQPRGGVR